MKHWTCHVFYAGLLHDSAPLSERRIFPDFDELLPEIYDGGYVLMLGNTRPGSFWKPDGWYRCDGTPVLDADVPAELRAMALLLS